VEELSLASLASATWEVMLMPVRMGGGSVLVVWKVGTLDTSK
jgi:hypothetical protein